MSRAAYMREYRAKRKAATKVVDLPWAAIALADWREVEGEAVLRLTAENRRLADEVARLKRELAARPVLTNAIAGQSAMARGVSDAYREFRPAPKPGKGK